MAKIASETPAFVYEPLAQPSHIRLVKIEVAADDIDLCHRLSLHHFHPSSAPPYLALSYAWGDTTISRHVLLNGARLGIAKNLYEALTGICDAAATLHGQIYQFLAHPVAEQYFWVDALCLNQRDDSEKSIQIRRMKDIYSSAITTLIWVGTFYLPPSGESPVDVATGQESAAQTPSTAKYAFHERVLTEWTTVLRRDYFSRLWTIQEYVHSSREPLVLLGDEILMLDHLIKHADLHATTAYELATFCAAFGDCGGFRAYLTSIEFRRESLAEQLLWILINTNGRQTSVPHDQIYGILGLVRASDLPEQLLPDYPKPFQQVFMDYCQYIFTETGDLDLLHLKKLPFSGKSSLPSWTIDFRTDAFVQFVERRADLEPEKVKLTRDGKGLNVQACKLYDVKMYWSAPDGPPDSLRSWLQQFHDVFLSSACALATIRFETVRRKWLSAVISTTSSNPSHLVKFDHSLGKAMLSTSGANGLFELLAQTNNLEAMINVLHWEMGSLFVLLDNGTWTARCDDDDWSPYPIQPVNDEIWMFKGAAIPFVLRHDRAEDAYMMMGQCARLDLNQGLYDSISADVER